MADITQNNIHLSSALLVYALTLRDIFNRAVDSDYQDPANDTAVHNVNRGQEEVPENFIQTLLVPAKISELMTKIALNGPSTVSKIENDKAMENLSLAYTELLQAKAIGQSFNTQYVTSLGGVYKNLITEFDAFRSEFDRFVGMIPR